MSEIPRPPLRLRDANVYIPVAIFLVSLAFRMIGIRWGLANSLHNQSYHPDEIPIWAASRQIDPLHLRFTPGFYNYGTLYLTILRVVADCVGGALIDPGADPTWGFVSSCHLLGRLVSSAAGSAMAAGLFVIARRWTSRFGALCAALLIAISPAQVVHSRFQTVDILASCLLTFSALFALKLLPSQGIAAGEASTVHVRKQVGLSGLFAGLSAGTKYTGVLGLLMMWAALAFTRPKGWIMEGLIGTLACLVAFVVAVPGVLLDTGRFMRDFTFEMVHTRTGHGLEFAHTAAGYWYHLSNLFAGIGTLMSLLGLVGLAYAAFKRKPWAIVLLAFFLPYVLVIGGSEVKFLRYTFPLYIAVAMGFGWIMGAANRKRGAYSCVVALGLLGLGGFLDSGGLRWAAVDTLIMASQDARDAAGAHLRAIGKGEFVGLVSDPWFWTPAVYADTALPRSVGPEGFLKPMIGAKDPQVVRSLYPSLDQRYDWDAHLLTDLRPSLVTFSNYETVHLERLKGSAHLETVEALQVGRFNEFASQLLKGYRLESQFGTSSDNPAATIPDMMYVTPVIQVWKRNDQR